MASIKNVRDHAIEELRSVLPAWNAPRDSHVRLLSLSENAVYDLEKWDVFEKENPHVFAGMYQFWCQKV